MNGSIFFGYPAIPRTLAETMRKTAERAKSSRTCTTWEDLEIRGRIVIEQVLNAIDSADLAVFDVTYPNENVLFEAGYAIARGNLVWLTLDSTVASARKAWNELAILKPIGYQSYRNSAELTAKITEYQASTPASSLYDDLIEPLLPEDTDQTTLLYCPPYEPFEAANRLSTLVEERRKGGLQVTIADPTESSLNPITWYAPKLASAAGVLINFAGASRNLAATHNSRNAFIAGLAVGLEIPVLMLSEDDYARPFDYENLVEVYDTATRCVQAARSWLDSLEVEGVRSTGHRAVARSKLAEIRLGEHVAENELTELSEYFVRTSAYDDVVKARDTLFVGHRGTGKTANALQAFEELSSNKEILAVLIKPAGFEFPALLAAVDRLPAYTHDYLYDTVWQFLIQTELARVVLTRVESRPTYVPLSEGEGALISYANIAPFDIRADMSVRLDQAIRHLMESLPQDVTVESSRVLMNEAFYSEALEQLRHKLGSLLKGRKRVAVFIDNLDKGWQKQENLDVLARFILGLLSARGRLVADFARHDWWRDEVKLTIAVFLRSDIFMHVRKTAREPDKLSISTISWRDPETLLSVLEERLSATWNGPGRQPQLWGGIFCEEVSGKSTAVYLTGVVLPRPRDLVYFCNAAISRAVDRRHDAVAEEDLLSAEEIYSQYAYEALLVENGTTIPEMEAVIFSFLGAPEIFTRQRAFEAFAEAGLSPEKNDSVLARLIQMSFLGVEIAPGKFEYPEVGSELQRALALAARLEPDELRRKLQIHRAYRSFLQVGVK